MAQFLKDLESFLPVLGHSLSLPATDTALPQTWKHVDKACAQLGHGRDSLRGGVRQLLHSCMQDRPFEVSNLAQANDSYWQMYRLITLQTVREILRFGNVHSEQTCDTEGFIPHPLNAVDNFVTKNSGRIEQIGEQAREFLKKTFEIHMQPMEMNDYLMLMRSKRPKRIAQVTMQSTFDTGEIAQNPVGFWAGKEIAHTPNNKGFTRPSDVRIGGREFLVNKYAGAKEIGIERLGVCSR